MCETYKHYVSYWSSGMIKTNSVRISESSEKDENTNQFLQWNAMDAIVNEKCLESGGNPVTPEMLLSKLKNEKHFL